MKGTPTEFFNLSLEERIARLKPKYKPTDTFIDPYTIVDQSSLLETLRAYQLADILGKYKLF